MQPIWTPASQRWSHNPRMKLMCAHFLSLVTRSVEPEANMMAQCGTDTLLLIGSQSCWLSMQQCKRYCYIQQRNMRHARCLYHISASWAWQCVCLSCCCLVTEQKVRRCEIKVKFWSDPSLILELLYQNTTDCANVARVGKLDICVLRVLKKKKHREPCRLERNMWH